MKFKHLLETCTFLEVKCPGSSLQYKGPFLQSKLNLGDYTDMHNVGGTFPVGEVFTEPQDLTSVNGTAKSTAISSSNQKLMALFSGNQYGDILFKKEKRLKWYFLMNRLKSR